MTRDAPAAEPAGAGQPQRLRRRRDFLRAAKSGVAQSRRAFKLQRAARGPGDDAPPRFGFTVTKKIAGAVGRNRIRRRLREALRLSRELKALPGHDYVFVARGAALSAPFSELLSQIADAVARLDADGKAANGHSRRNRHSAP
jgi:ribonuclease P protein component